MNKLTEVLQSALKMVDSTSPRTPATPAPAPTAPVMTPASTSMGSGIGSRYDYTLSTEDNHCTTANEEVFVGKFAHIRKCLDYTYHKYYTPERQLLQDKLMTLFNATVVHDDDTGAVCDSLDHCWIVFTAGPMGAGKSHTLVWFSSRDLFPLESFVRVDPDSLRELLPETKEYIKRNPATAGALTQKEVGYLAEILTLYALKQGKNVLVDGSLRDAQWYREYIQSLREQYDNIKVAIFHVTASEKTILARCRKRELITGRHVPESLVRETMEQLPQSINALAPYVDVVVTIENEDASNGGSDGPRLVESEVMAYYHREGVSDGHSSGSSNNGIADERHSAGGRTASDDISGSLSSSFVLPTRGRSNTASSTGSSRSRGRAMKQLGIGNGRSTSEAPAVIALPLSPLGTPLVSLPVGIPSSSDEATSLTPGPDRRSSCTPGTSRSTASDVAEAAVTLADSTSSVGDGRDSSALSVSPAVADVDGADCPTSSDTGASEDDDEALTDLPDDADAMLAPPLPMPMRDSMLAPVEGSEDALAGISAADAGAEVGAEVEAVVPPIPPSLLRSPRSYEEFMLMFRMVSCRQNGCSKAGALARCSGKPGRGFSPRYRSHSDHFHANTNSSGSGIGSSNSSSTNSGKPAAATEGPQASGGQLGTASSDGNRGCGGLQEEVFNSQTI